MRTTLRLAVLIGALCVPIGCSSSGADGPEPGGAGMLGGARAEAAIQPRSGSTLEGEAVFVERMGGVEVTIVVRNGPPGWHAAHVHEVGDCSAADGSSAGGHFNPGGHEHGAPHALEHHAGDLGNLWIQEDGTGYHAVFMPELTVAAGSHSVVGRAIVVHEKADDLVSQPTGDAGGRIGCGVIR